MKEDKTLITQFEYAYELVLLCLGISLLGLIILKIIQVCKKRGLKE